MLRLSPPQALLGLLMVLSLCLHCRSKREEVSYDQQLQEAVKAFDGHQLDKAIFLLQKLQHDYPKEPLVLAYLAQSYGERASINILELFKLGLKLSEDPSQEEMEATLAEVWAMLPPGKDENFADLLAAVSIYEQSSKLQPDEKQLYANNLMYRTVFLLFLCKEWQRRISSSDSLGNLRAQWDYLHSLKDDPYLTQTQAQISAILQLLSQLPDKLQKIANKILKFDKVNLNFQGKVFTISIRDLSQLNFDILLLEFYQKAMDENREKLQALLAPYDIPFASIEALGAQILRGEKSPDQALATLWEQDAVQKIFASEKYQKLSAELKKEEFKSRLEKVLTQALPELDKASSARDKALDQPIALPDIPSSELLPEAKKKLENLDEDSSSAELQQKLEESNAEAAAAADGADAAAAAGAEQLKANEAKRPPAELPNK